MFRSLNVRTAAESFDERIDLRRFEANCDLFGSLVVHP
jgi:hypothetical protein